MMSSNRVAQDQARLRLGLVGCGRVVERYHLSALQQSTFWKLAAACDPHDERRAWVRRHFPQLPVFETSLAMHKEVALDAVLIATPPPTHVHLVIQALEMGSHVLVEKPMALTTADATQMLAASLRLRRHLAVGFSRRYRRTYVALKERLDAYGQENLQGVFFDLSSDQASWRPISRFLGDDQLGGGVLDDVASHQLDLLPRLIGHEILKVRARRLHTNDRRSEWVAYDARFDNGLTACCRAGHAPGAHDQLLIQFKDRALVVLGNRIVETRYLPRKWSLWFGKLTGKVDSALRRPALSETAVSLFAKQLDDFARAVHCDARPVRNLEAERGCQTVRAVEACRQSLQGAADWVLL